MTNEMDNLIIGYLLGGFIRMIVNNMAIMDLGAKDSTRFMEHQMKHQVGHEIHCWRLFWELYKDSVKDSGSYNLGFRSFGDDTTYWSIKWTIKLKP